MRELLVSGEQFKGLSERSDLRDKPNPLEGEQPLVGPSAARNVGVTGGDPSEPVDPIRRVGRRIRIKATYTDTVEGVEVVVPLVSQSDFDKQRAFQSEQVDKKSTS